MGRLKTQEEYVKGKLLENYVKDLFKQLDIEQEVDFNKVREECKTLGGINYVEDYRR